MRVRAQFGPTDAPKAGVRVHVLAGGCGHVRGPVHAQLAGRAALLMPVYQNAAAHCGLQLLITHVAATTQQVCIYHASSDTPKTTRPAISQLAKTRLITKRSVITVSTGFFGPWLPSSP